MKTITNVVGSGLGLFVLFAGGVAAAGCADVAAPSPDAPRADVAPTAEVNAFRDRAARTLAVAPGADVLGPLLAAHPEGATFEEIATWVPELRGELDALTIRSARELGAFDVPEAWLYTPRVGHGDPGAPPLVAFAPVDAKHASVVTAYDPRGQVVRLDAKRAPEVPVIVIETHGRRAMHKGVARANELLAAAGLQPKPRGFDPSSQSGVRPLEATTSGDGLWTTRLDSIELANVEEPWISGAAEVYAIVSGVVEDNRPVLRVVDLPYLDEAATVHEPQQIVINWSDFRYQAANFQLFEHDDNTSYEGLVSALITAIGAVGSLAGEPEIGAIAEIANRIVAAMPDTWFVNDDDYLDSFYTIEKSVKYEGRWGAAHNARVTLNPYFLRANR